MSDRTVSPATLLVDVGSSRVKWRWYVEGRIRQGGSEVHRGRPEKLVPGIVAQYKIARILVASVLDAKTGTRFESALAELSSSPPELARSVCASHGVTNAYDQPERLGVDRWLSLIAAWHLIKGPVVVVDCGTAVTMDVIDGTGRHLGGHILPGVGLAHRCLMAHTRLDVDLIAPHGLLGRDTASGVANGIHHSVAALVERLSRISGSGETTAPVIMTGGDAPSIASLVNEPPEIRPDLVFEGLAWWAGLEINR